MFDFIEVWERVCKVTKWSKQKDCANFLGIRQSSVAGAKKKGSFPIGWSKKIAQEFNVDVDWLLTGKGPMRPGESDPDEVRSYSGDELKKNGFTLVPRYDVQVSLGGGALVDSEQIVEHLAFKTAWLKKEMNLEPRKLALISTIGDSMYPTIREGDLLLVDLRRREVGDDAIYIIRRDSTLVAKRFQRLFDGTVSIKSDNSIYKEEVVPREAAKELNLIGRVVWIGRKA